jgi:triosephosphate isomerase (TIM)
MKNLIVINFKTYSKSTGKKAVNLAKMISGAILCVQTADISEIARLKKTVYAQHIDYFEQGRNTGFITPESVKNSGAKGTLINHSEHKLDYDVIKKTINRCKKIRLTTIVCADSVEEAKKIALFGPEFIAFEIPELISTGKSVTEYKGEEIKNFVKSVTKINNKIKVLCGAGITKKEDVAVARELGCQGVLLASGIVFSKNPGKLVKEMIDA